MSHPFLSGKKFTRLVGQEAQYDVFISYRVNSDLDIAEILYDNLTKRSLKVWWDKKCLQPGLEWKQGFIMGLLQSRTFVSLVSQGAISNPTRDNQNYSKLQETSPCDNVLLEQRLALELYDMGLVEGIFPIFIGNKNGQNYDFFSWSIFSGIPDTVVSSVEQELIRYMSEQGLGSPLTPNKTVLSIINGIKQYQGSIVECDFDIALKNTITGIEKMVEFCKSAK